MWLGSWYEISNKWLLQQVTTFTTSFCLLNFITAILVHKSTSQQHDTSTVDQEQLLNSHILTDFVRKKPSRDIDLDGILNAYEYLDDDQSVEIKETRIQIFLLFIYTSCFVLTKSVLILSPLTETYLWSSDRPQSWEYLTEKTKIFLDKARFHLKMCLTWPAVGGMLLKVLYSVPLVPAAFTSALFIRLIYDNLLPCIWSD